MAYRDKHNHGKRVESSEVDERWFKAAQDPRIKIDIRSRTPEELAVDSRKYDLPVEASYDEWGRGRYSGRLFVEDDYVGLSGKFRAAKEVVKGLKNLVTGSEDNPDNITIYY